MTEKAVVPRQETAPAVPMEDIGLSGNYDQSDFTVPVWALVQSTSTEFDDAKPGQFATRDGRILDRLIVVPLRIAATRTLWPEQMGEGRRPLCASNDRVDGRPFGEFVPYDSPIPDVYRCADCPHIDDQPWTTEHGCYKSYALLCALVDYDDEPAIIRVKGTSVAPFRDRLLAHSMPRGRRAGSPVWTREFILNSEEGDSAKGKYHILMPRLESVLPDPEPYHLLALELAGVAVEAVEDVAEEEEPEGGAAE